ncbi:MAG: hypothetical protein WBF87_02180 [Mesorhizobium sp.]
MQRSLAPTIWAVLASMALASGPAFADEKKTSPAALPGVDTGYSIVAPAPEPDNRSEAERQHDLKNLKVGNWDVKISGYVWYQVGASSDGR